MTRRPTLHGVATAALALGFVLTAGGFFFDQQDVGPGANFGAAFVLLAGMSIGVAGLVMAVMSFFYRPGPQRSGA